jgi:hypothetical protein
LKEGLAAWNRRFSLLALSAQICGPNTHPDEITRYAGTFEAFVVNGDVPDEPAGEVVKLHAVKEPITTPTAPKAPNA